MCQWINQYYNLLSKGKQVADQNTYYLYQLLAGNRELNLLIVWNMSNTQGHKDFPECSKQRIFPLCICISFLGMITMMYD